MFSAVVAVLCRAKRLIILSDIDGLYDSDPRLHANARLIERVEQINDTIYALAGGAGSRRGTGGMRTKLQAASLATAQGIDTVITNGNHQRKKTTGTIRYCERDKRWYAVCWEVYQMKRSYFKYFASLLLFGPA